MNRRQREIVKVVSQDSRITVHELAEQFNVSTVTIRQDLDYLESEGFLKRIHGGVTALNSDDISSRLVVNYESKLKIARRASEFVETGETIVIEGGSTNTVLAKEVIKKSGITIITPNIFIARECRKSDTHVILLGGIYQKESESLIGSLARICIDNLNFKKAFFGIDGFTIETGFTSKDMMRAEIATYIARKSEEVFVLTDSSKFGKTELTMLFDAEGIDYVITDNGIRRDERMYLENRGVTVIVA
jgi:DeoR/GlpR family transcriptional regulator of sugar metabolism